MRTPTHTQTLPGFAHMGLTARSTVIHHGLWQAGLLGTACLWTYLVSKTSSCRQHITDKLRVHRAKRQVGKQEVLPKGMYTLFQGQGDCLSSHWS